MTDTERCPVDVWNNYQAHTCGKPVKRDGLCGIHAAAKDRRERNAIASRQAAHGRKERASRIRTLLGLPDGLGTITSEYGKDWFMCDPDALLDHLEGNDQ